MVAIKNISIAAALLSGAAHQALAAPIAASDLTLRSDISGASGASLEARAPDALDAELEERDIDERDLDLDERDFDLDERDIDIELVVRELEERKLSIGKFFKKIGHGLKKAVKGVAKLILRDLEGRDISEIDERELADMITRSLDEAELDTRDLNELYVRDFDFELDERDLEERKLSIGKFFKKIGHGLKKAVKGVAKLILRDLEGRDLSEIDERELADLVARSFDEVELDARDFDELYERDFEELEERDFEELEERDFEEPEERDVDELDERDFDELDERDFDELDERDSDELDERDFEEYIYTRYYLANAEDSEE